MRRHLQASLWPFSYETDLAAIRDQIAAYDAAIQVERECAAFWLKRGHRHMANRHRGQIDRIATVRRNGLARLRALEGSGSGSLSMARAA